MSLFSEYSQKYTQVHKSNRRQMVYKNRSSLALLKNRLLR